MTDELRLHAERQVHDLICGGLDARERQDVLSEIASNDDMRRLLRHMIRDQQLARSAFGYDAVDDSIRANLSRLKGSLASGQVPRADREGWLGGLFTFGRVRQAAMLLLIIGLAVVSAASYRNRLAVEARLAQLKATVPVFPVRFDITRYRQLWQELAEGTDTWVLVREEGGEFGNIGWNSPANETGGRVVLLQCRVLDDDGHCVYTADLLTLDRALTVDSGSIAGHPVRIDVATSGRSVTVGLSLDSNGGVLLGARGQLSADKELTEIGRFRDRNQTLRVFAGIRQLFSSHT